MKTPFNIRAASAIHNRELQQALYQGTRKYADLRKKAFESTVAPLALRARAREIRRRTFQELNVHMETLIRCLKEKGVHVHMAKDARMATETILAIARRHGVRMAVKSKSMASEEIHLNAALEEGGIHPVETDLGEWIIQLANESPSHLIAPALHKTTEQIARLFQEKVDPGVGEDPVSLTHLARRKIRENFLRADMGISGVNFAVAETGTLCLVTNEGNGRMVSTLPKVHVAIMGFEKVVPTLEDCFTLLAVLPRSATGQKLSVYFTMLTGPHKPAEADGPEEIYLILLDGGRSRHLGGPFQEAFHCIRCGACQNACPVFQTVGGHAYGTVYGGPIGSILSPMLQGLDISGELPAASSLCGACQEACPVLVDIPRMLLEMRKAKVAQKIAPPTERLAFRLTGWAIRHPAIWKGVGLILSWLSRPLSGMRSVRWLPGSLGAWLEGRDLPLPARKSFRSRWRERNRYHSPSRSLSTTKNGDAPQEEGPSVLVERTRRALELGHGLRHGAYEAPEGTLPEVEVPNPTSRFLEEFEAVGGAGCRVTSLDAARDYLLEIAEKYRGSPVAVSADLTLPARSWLRNTGFNLIPENGNGDNRNALSGVGLGITGCAFGIAEMGTLVMLSGPRSPRLYSLLPEAHLAVLSEEHILAHLSALGPRLAELLHAPTDGPSCVSLVTGPSRSADIGLTLTSGVHGPGEVYVLIFPPTLV